MFASCLGLGWEWVHVCNGCQKTNGVINASKMGTIIEQLAVIYRTTELFKGSLVYWGSVMGMLRDHRHNAIISIYEHVLNPV